MIPTTVNNTAYVLISKGNTGKCYFNSKTGTVNTTKPTGNLLKNCVQNYTNGSNVDRIIYQGYSKSFDNIVVYKTLSDMVTKASTTQEDVRNLGGGIISNQLRVDSNLSTDSKEIVGAINELKARLDAIQSTNDNNSKLFLMGATAQGARPTARSQANVYMQNGTLYLTKTTDLSGTANNKPAFIVGGSDAQAHIEIDSNEIHAKANGTTVGPLYLNDQGGDVYISGNANASLRVGKSGGTSKIYLNGQELALTKQSICEMMYPVGSYYIGRYDMTIDQVYDRLGCGTWKKETEIIYFRQTYTYFNAGNDNIGYANQSTNNYTYRYKVKEDKDRIKLTQIERVEWPTCSRQHINQQDFILSDGHKIYAGGGFIDNESCFINFGYYNRDLCTPQSHKVVVAGGARFYNHGQHNAGNVVVENTSDGFIAYTGDDASFNAAFINYAAFMPSETTLSDDMNNKRLSLFRRIE